MPDRLRTPIPGMDQRRFELAHSVDPRRVKTTRPRIEPTRIAERRTQHSQIAELTEELIRRGVILRGDS